MKLDSLKQYSKIRTALLEERSALQRRLSQINAALGPASERSSHAPSQGTGSRSDARARRIQNALSLKKAILKVTQSKPLTKEEILAAVKRLGYRFATARPISTLNAYLYRKGEFKRKGGRFSRK